MVQWASVRSIILAVFLRVARHPLVGGAPHARMRAHVLDELCEHDDAGAMADDVRVHRQQKQPALFVGDVELGGV